MKNPVTKIWHTSLFNLLLVLIWALFIYCLMLTSLSTLPSVDVPSPYSHLIDKVIHTFVFGVLSYLLWRFFYQSLANRRSSSLFLSFFITASYAYLIEYWQSFTSTRSYSFWDLACGVLGGGVALLIIKLTHKSKF